MMAFTIVTASGSLAMRSSIFLGGLHKCTPSGVSIGVRSAD
jgi:hypothetical protein